MKKSLARFIIGQTKENGCFEDRTNIRITYIEGCTKYFDSQEKADAARSRYDGGYSHDDNGKLTITRVFEYEEACSVPVSTAEENGWFQVIRQ